MISIKEVELPIGGWDRDIIDKDSSSKFKVKLWSCAKDQQNKHILGSQKCINVVNAHIQTIVK